MTGGRVIHTLDTWLRVFLGDHRPSMQVLGIDARDLLARGMTDLVSRRWASTESKIVITKVGITNGLAPQATLTTTGPDGQTRLWTVITVATGQTGSGVPFLVAMPASLTSAGDPARVSAAFLVARPYPVTWADVRRMNDYGLLVQSHQMFPNFPADSELDPQMAQMLGPGQQANNLLLFLAVVGIFIETTLLAGPAFAVGAAR